MTPTYTIRRPASTATHADGTPAARLLADCAIHGIHTAIVADGIPVCAGCQADRIRALDAAAAELDYQAAAAAAYRAACYQAGEHFPIPGRPAGRPFCAGHSRPMAECDAIAAGRRQAQPAQQQQQQQQPPDAGADCCPDQYLQSTRQATQCVACGTVYSSNAIRYIPASGAHRFDAPPPGCAGRRQ